MNKNQYIALCAKKSKLNKRQVESVLNSAKEVLLDALSLGQDININGVGKFFLKFKPARTITSNLNGKELIVDQKFCVAFKSSEKLSRQIF